MTSLLAEELKKELCCAMKKLKTDRGRLAPKSEKNPYSHLKLLWGWVIYFVCFVLTERLIPPERCYPVHCFLDDWIPFCEIFLIPYVFWYFLIVFTLVYFLLHRVESFRKLQTYLIILQVLAIVIYVVLPSRQDLRPAQFARDNALTRGVAFLYSIDTNTGVCPSMHVAYSIGIASAWLKEDGIKARWKALIVVIAGVICLSTMFIKQHSAVDFFAALPLCLLAECLVYGKGKSRVFDLAEIRTCKNKGNCL